MMPATPVTLISGYLGAGKTTLVNNLLRGAEGRRLAVLVNDFGDLPIDAELIEAREGNLISISGGCVCCSFGSDLVAALMELKASDRPIDHLLIEASGIALPTPIAQSLRLVPGVAFDSIVTLIDAETILARTTDRYVGDTVIKQLLASDILIVNKIDLVPPERIEELQSSLRRIAPQARLLLAQNANLSPALLLGEPGLRHDGISYSAAFEAHSSATVATRTFDTDGRADPEAVAKALTDADLGILRAKGFVRDADGNYFVIQIVGRRFNIAVAPPWITGRSRLSCIGLAGQMNAAVAIHRIEQCFTPRG